MATLLYGSELDGMTTAGALRLPVPAAPEPSLPTTPDGPATQAPVPNALWGMMRSLAEVAAVWVGLAMFGLGIAYTVSPLAEVFLVVAGAWLVAMGIGYAVTSKESTL